MYVRANANAHHKEGAIVVHPLSHFNSAPVIRVTMAHVRSELDALYLVPLRFADCENFSTRYAFWPYLSIGR